MFKLTTLFVLSALFAGSMAQYDFNSSMMNHSGFNGGMMGSPSDPSMDSAPYGGSFMPQSQFGAPQPQHSQFMPSPPMSPMQHSMNFGAPFGHSAPMHTSGMGMGSGTAMYLNHLEETLTSALNDVHMMKSESGQGFKGGIPTHLPHDHPAANLPHHHPEYQSALHQHKSAHAAAHGHVLAHHAAGPHPHAAGVHPHAAGVHPHAAGVHPHAAGVHPHAGGAHPNAGAPHQTNVHPHAVASHQTGVHPHAGAPHAPPAHAPAAHAGAPHAGAHVPPTHPGNHQAPMHQHPGRK